MALNIKKAIKDHGLEVKEVASRMGISATALSQHLNGKMYKGKRVDPNPSVDILKRIADAIGCDVVELFDPIKNDNEHTIICPKCGKEIRVKLEVPQDQDPDTMCGGKILIDRKGNVSSPSDAK